MTALVNPFAGYGALQEPLQFVGRDELRAELWDLLEAGENVSTVGAQGSGKSALLKLIAHEAPKRLEPKPRVVPMNIQSTSRRAEVSAALARALGGRTVADLIQLLKANRVILLIDNLGALDAGLGHGWEVRNWLKGLSDNRIDAFVQIVATSIMPINYLFSRDVEKANFSSPYYSIMPPPLNLEDFSPDEVEKFITQALLGTPFKKEQFADLLNRPWNPGGLRKACRTKCNELIRSLSTPIQSQQPLKNSSRPNVIETIPIPTSATGGSSSAKTRVPNVTRADVAILTVLREEYRSVLRHLKDVTRAPSTKANPNIYSWVFGSIYSETFGRDYKVILGMIGRAGNTQSALGISTTVKRWQPRFVLLVGIAGGFERDELQKGDVVFSDVIYGYEYGKLDKRFIPRHDWVFQADIGLFNVAQEIADDIPAWGADFGHEDGTSIKAIPGDIASGDKVVDDPDIEFFRQVLDSWPKLHAVEMEGAGAGAAIEHVRSLGIVVGFLMIRGISDIPRKALDRDLSATDPEQAEIRGTKERDNWKKKAAGAAASFAASLIASGLPTPPVLAPKERASLPTQHNKPQEAITKRTRIGIRSRGSEFRVLETERNANAGLSLKHAGRVSFEIDAMEAMFYQAGMYNHEVAGILLGTRSADGVSVRRVAKEFQLDVSTIQLQPGEVVVGLWHSHPGLGIIPTPSDESIMLKEPHLIHVIIDTRSSHEAIAAYSVLENRFVKLGIVQIQQKSAEDRTES